MLTGTVSTPVRGTAAVGADRSGKNADERLQELKKQLAEAETAAAEYRKEEA